MSPQDASFLHIEDDVSHMHVGSAVTFEGPPPPFEDVLKMIRGKLPLIPRYRQRVKFVPGDLSRPVWVDDPHFDLEYHVRHTALPPPGGSQEARNLVGRLMSQQLDRSKPLWEMWMVEGLGGGRWAMVSKTHHCMVDGVSGTDLMTVVMDDSPKGSEPVPDNWAPGREPSDAELVAQAVGSIMLSPYEQWRAVRSALRAPGQAVGQLRTVIGGIGSMRRIVVPTPQSTLNGPIGPHRTWAWARTTLDDVKRVRKSLGGTVNDVVLTIIAGGFRDLLLSRGESVDRVVRTLVPVSVRAKGEKGVYNNKVSGMIAELPVGIEDPVERLGSMRAQMDGLKESKQAVAGEALTAMTGFAPPMLLALGTRLSARFPQRNVNTVTTNVPGPQHPLYAAGREMLEAFPYVPLGGSMRVGVAIFSYNGQLNYGVTGDRDTAPDVTVLAEGIEDGMAQLLERC